MNNPNYVDDYSDNIQLFGKRSNVKKRNYNYIYISLLSLYVTSNMLYMAYNVYFSIFLTKNAGLFIDRFSKTLNLTDTFVEELIKRFHFV